jgi:hypothetical protein
MTEGSRLCVEPEMPKYQVKLAWHEACRSLTVDEHVRRAVARSTAQETVYENPIWLLGALAPI